MAARQAGGHRLPRGDHCRFRLDESYRDSGDRAILGLHFEQQASLDYSAALRLPPWFSNLLPEGEQQRWIAEARGVSEDREMELLAQVGHDLPGAVRVLPDDEPPPEVQDAGPCHPPGSSDETPGWRFSLAGVGLKFSMRHRGARFTLPAYGAGGDWIVKLPGTEHEQVPRNEFAMMTLASAVGIDTPEVRLVHRDEIDHLPPRAWRGPEEWAYAVR